MDETAIARAEALSQNIGAEMAGRAIHGGWRGQLAATFQFVSLQHHGAIIALLQQSRPTSAVALLRSQFEAHLRGLWILVAASEAEIESVSGGGEFPRVEKLVEQVKPSSMALRVVKDLIWPVMCDYTHTGLRQVRRNITDEGIGLNYSSKELAVALQASNALAMLAADALAVLAGDADLRSRFEQAALQEIRRHLPDEDDGSAGS